MALRLGGLTRRFSSKWTGGYWLGGVGQLTGGRMGVGETVGRAVHQWRLTNDREPHIYHLLPIGYSPIDYGATIFCGRNMVERREVLGRVAELYLVIEGGPGTEYEAEVALSKGATVVPVGRSGGYSRILYDDMPIPHGLSAEDWTTLGADGVSLNELARAVESIMSVFLADGNWPRDRRRTQP